MEPALISMPGLRFTAACASCGLPLGAHVAWKLLGGMAEPAVLTPPPPPPPPLLSLHGAGSDRHARLALQRRVSTMWNGSGHPCSLESVGRHGRACCPPHPSPSPCMELALSSMPGLRFTAACASCGMALVIHVAWKVLGGMAGHAVPPPPPPALPLSLHGAGSE